jgi:hypothetical protein
MRYLSIIILLLVATAASAQSGRNRNNKSDGLEFRHIANFTPFSGIVAYDHVNPGVGLDYEYIISQEHGIGVHIPFVIGFAGPDQDDFYYSEYKHTSIHAAPGIRFHTARRGSTVDFITGPAVLFGNMHFSPNDDYYNPSIGRNPYDYGMLGFAADNTLNFYRNHFVFGLDVRVGTLTEVREGSRFFIHFGLHFGGNF